jgi:hypothetical protein
MLNVILLIAALAVGAFIGWSVPQPSWAKRLSAWVEGKLAMAWGRIR